MSSEEAATTTSTATIITTTTTTSTSGNNPPTAAPLRIGFLGCASIAKKNALAILQIVESSSPEKSPSSSSCYGCCCCLTAIASRSSEKAEAFLREIVIPRATTTTAASAACSTTSSRVQVYGGPSAYDDIIASSDVDAIYIPLPTTLHREWATKALMAGKHVLLEKPVAMSVTEFQEILFVAHQNRKFLMDGTMFVHHPRTRHFVQAVTTTDSNNNNNNNKYFLGRLTRIEAGFSFCGNDDFLRHNIRVQKDADPLGCLGDLGWYVIRLALLVVMGYNNNNSSSSNNNNVKVTYENVAISAQVVDYQVNEEGIPMDATCLVWFRNNIVLSFHCGFGSHFRQYVHVVGTKRGATMDDFVLPKAHPLTYQIQAMELTKYDLITEHEYEQVTIGAANDENSNNSEVQEVHMWRNFSRFSKALDANEGWGDDSSSSADGVLGAARELSQISTANQKILDALMASIQQGGAKVAI